MKRKTVSEMMLMLLLTSILAMAFNVSPAKAQRYVRVYVDQPQGYIPGVPVGDSVTVDIIIEVSGIADNTPEGLIGWEMNIAVDPTVLGIYDPPQYSGATFGYFLYDFALDHGYSAPTLFPGTVDPDIGFWYDLGETIVLTPSGGAGEFYSGRKLVTLVFYSKSQTAHSRIDLIEVEYLDQAGNWQSVDEVVDGDYNQPVVPEFPLGLGLMMAIASAIPIVYLWRTRKKVITKQKRGNRRKTRSSMCSLFPSY